MNSEKAKSLSVFYEKYSKVLAELQKVLENHNLNNKNYSIIYDLTKRLPEEESFDTDIKIAFYEIGINDEREGYKALLVSTEFSLSHCYDDSFELYRYAGFTTTRNCSDEEFLKFSGYIRSLPNQITKIRS
jgi:hypothetical protein